jgi:hypothetical protein
VGSALIFVLIIGLFVLAQVTASVNDWWLSVWSNNSESHSLNYWLSVCALLLYSLNCQLCRLFYVYSSGHTFTSADRPAADLTLSGAFSLLLLARALTLVYGGVKVSLPPSLPPQHPLPL